MKEDQSDGGPSVGKHKSSKHSHNKKVSLGKLENNPFGRTHKSAGAKGGDSYAKAVRERESRDKRAQLPIVKKSRDHKGRGWSMSPQRSQVSEGPGPEKSHNKKSKTTSSKGKKLYVPEALPPFYLQSRYSPSWGPEDKKRVKKERSEGEVKETTTADAGAEAQPKDKPNFEVTGNLMEDTNKIKGVIVKYNEPPEARVPKKRWRLYPFKAGEPLPVLHIHRQSAFMCGRDRRISEIPLDHPSCSKQHAVLQFRSIPLDNGGAGDRRIIKPYVIDLASANGTYLNNARLEAQRYYELMERDVLKFGFSTREYVLLHEHSEGTEPEDQQNSLNPAPEGTTVEGDVSEPDYEEE